LLGFLLGFGGLCLRKGKVDFVRKKILKVRGCIESEGED